MRCVLDSSVAVKWGVPEPLRDKAVQLRVDFLNGLHELLAPDILSIEVAHALTRAERQGRISPADGALALGEVLSTPLQLFPSLGLLPRAYALSSANRIGVYDCLYVALAER